MRALLVAIVLLGCSERAAAPRAPATTECAHLGDRCQLPDGPIGICSESTAPCDDPPCLACMSQH